MPYVEMQDLIDALHGPELAMPLFEGNADNLAEFYDDATALAWFAENEAIAAKQMNRILARAGYTTPLETPIADEDLKRAYIQTLVGALLGARSLPGLDTYAKAGADYFAGIADGSIIIIGLDTTPATNSGVVGQRVDTPFWDTDWPSERDYLLPTLGRGSTWRN